MNYGEIYFVDLEPTIGYEQRGHRPVLVISPDRFNRITRMPIIVPITSGGNFARKAGFAVSLEGSGTQTTGVIRCDQPRSLDLVARNARVLERVPPFILQQVADKLAAILSITSPLS